MAATMIVLSAVTAVGVVVGVDRLDGNLHAGAAIPEMAGASGSTTSRSDQSSGPTGPLNVLVLGTDTRSGSGDKIDGEKGCGCSDTTILLHASADRKTVYGISIPRDALVKPVSCTQGHNYVGPDGTTPYVEWNQAFSIGGPACTAQQVQDDFGVKVDDYVVVDFEGLQRMVDAVGGVNVCTPYPLYDPRYAHLDLPAGPSVHLDGASALKYVRLRHGYYPISGTYTRYTALTPRLDGTDPGRIQRQQYFISRLADTLFSAGTQSSPRKLFGFADALTSSITTNPGMASVKDLVSLASQFRSFDLHHLHLLTLPSRNYGAGPYVDRVQVLPQATTLMQRVAADEPLKTLPSNAQSAGKQTHKTPAQVAQAREAVGLCAQG